MKEGYYWFREATGAQLHILHVDKPQRVKDVSGFLPRIRGPRYVSDFKGTWWMIEEPSEPTNADAVRS